MKAQYFPVSSHTLGNGMSSFVEDHHIPRVALHFFFRVGSRNEHPGNTGISHFLEHMIFNGAQKYGLASLTAKLRRAAAITTRTPHQTDGLHTTGFLQQR